MGPERRCKSGMDGGLTAASMVSPPHHLRTDEILSKRWGPPHFAAARSRAECTDPGVECLRIRVGIGDHRLTSRSVLRRGSPLVSCDLLDWRRLHDGPPIAISVFVRTHDHPESTSLGDVYS